MWGGALAGPVAVGAHPFRRQAQLDGLHGHSRPPRAAHRPGNVTRRLLLVGRQLPRPLRPLYRCPSLFIGGFFSGEATTDEQ